MHSYFTDKSLHLYRAKDGDTNRLYYETALLNNKKI